ncbi:MAG: serine hydrolase domain-containing protein [Pseudomonadota bacterium]
MKLTLDPAKSDRIRDWMQGYVDDRRFAGCSVLALQDGQEVLFDACGLRDVAAQAPWTRDTVARIYSMTKPVTSLVMMMLVEEGRIHLDAPVSSVLPEFSDMTCLVPSASALDQVEPCAPPTLHQLLTHTSGLSYPFNPGLVAEAMQAEDLVYKHGQGSLADVTRKVAALPLAFRPGSRWEYSVGIDVIGRVIEEMTGQSLGAVMAERVFGPLGMTETAFGVPQQAADRFAALYTPLAGGAMDLNAQEKGAETLRLVDAPDSSAYHAPTLHSGGGGLVGTIDDYARFAEALRAGGKGLVSPATLAFMLRNHLPGDIASMGPASFAEQPMDGMGFGLGGAVVLDAARARVPGSVGDFSWGGMASTFFWVDPVHDLSVIFFTQLSPSSSYPARPELKALIHGCLT